MRAIALISFLPLAALAHPEGLWWGTDTCFNSPDNTDNECSDHQRAGFDWSDLADGAFSSYGGFDFSGFMSGIGFGGSASGGRCISGKLSRSSAASLVISAGVDISAFSITNLRVSTSIETEIDIVYGMPDGSTCRDTAWCSSEAEDVSNDQCGGAISVGFELAENSDSEACDLDIHLIDFDCSPGPKPPGGGHDHHPSPLPSPSSPPSLPSPSAPGIPGTSTPVIPPPAIPTPVIPSQGTTPPVGPVVTPPVPTSIPVQIPPPSSGGSGGGSSSPPEDQTTTVVTYETVTTCPVTNTITSGASVTTEVSSTVSTITLTSTSTICTQCAHPPTPGVPTGVKPTSAAPPPAQTTTVVTYETVTTCPVTTTITAGSTTSTSVYTTVSTVTLTSTNTIIHPTSAPSSSPLPPSECPTVVPKCINTWLDLPKCDSNADTACFCPSSDFTNKVIACIQAWGSSAAEIQSALSYFTGICAAFVPTNPGIVTAVPTTITLGPVAPKPTAVAPIPNGPPAAPAPVTTLTYSTYTVTVPQVGFSTSAGASTTAVGLIPGPAPTGVTPGGTATRIPNPWTASSTLATNRGGSSTGVAGPTETPPILSNGGAKTVVSGVWAVGVAVLVGFV